MRLSDGLAHHRISVPMLLSFCACFVDIICTIGLFSTFTAFITGTLAVLCSELVQGAEGAPLKLIVLGTFVVSSFVSCRLLAARRDRARAPLRPLLPAEGGLLVLFMLVAGLAAPLEDPLAGATILAVVLATTAMALHNVVPVNLLSHHAPTTIMTGNTVKLIATMVESRLVRDRAPEAEAARRRSSYYVRIVATFVLGGAAGAGGWLLAGFWALGLPASLVLLVAAAQRPNAAPAAAAGG